MLSFKYKNGQTFTTTLKDLKGMEPREWVFEDCVEIKAGGDEARVLATWWNNHEDKPWLPTPVSLTQQAFAGEGADCMVRILRDKLSTGPLKEAAQLLATLATTPQPSKRELKDLVEYIMAMPVDLRERMGIRVLPTIPTKAVWRLNHQADPSMGWWGVMETRAGLSWGMPAPEMPEAPRKGNPTDISDAMVLAIPRQQLRPIDGDKTFDSASPLRPQFPPVTDRDGCRLEAGDCVTVTDTIGSYPAWTRAKVEKVNPRMGKVMLEDYEDWVDPKLLAFAGVEVQAPAKPSPDLLPVLVRYIQALKAERIASMGLEVKWEQFPDKEEIWVVTMPTPRHQGCPRIPYNFDIKPRWSARIHLNQYRGNTLRMTDGTHKAPTFEELAEMLGLYLQHDLPTQLLAANPLMDKHHPDLLDWSTGIREGDTVEVVDISKDERWKISEQFEVESVQVLHWGIFLYRGDGKGCYANCVRKVDVQPDHVIEVGDTVEVMEGDEQWKAGDTFVVKSIDVQPWGAFLIDAGGRSLRRNRARKVAVQQEGRGFREDTLEERQGLHKWLARRIGETSVVGCCAISRDRSGHTFEISTHDGKPEWLATIWPEHINFFQQDFATGWDFNLLCKALGYAEVVTLPREGDLVRVVSGGSEWTAGEVFKVAGVEKRGRATMLASGDGRSIMAYRVEIAATRVDMDAEPDDLQKALAHLATAMDFVKSAIDARG